MTRRDHDPKNFTQDGPLHAIRLGDRRARRLVFLHGITGSRRYWQRRVAPLARRYRLLIPDLLGFGLSPKPPVEYTIPRYCASVRKFLEDAGATDRPHVLVGHSLGALIAIQYAIDHYDDVEALILLSLPRFESAEEAHRVFWHGSPQYRRLLNEHSVAENLAQMRRSGIDLFLKYIIKFPWGVLADCRKFTMRSLTSTLEQCLLNYRVDDTLSRLRPLPILLMHGLRDGVAPFDNIKDLPRRYPFMRLEVIPSSGHHVFLTHSRHSLRVIESFLESVPSRDNGRRGDDPRRGRARVGRLMRTASRAT
ncbi:MAG: alpha/beta fold hydrolase [Acidobacteriota bacterium]